MPLPDFAVTGVEETAFAKINLALHVRARRDDGYHALESVFAFADGGVKSANTILLSPASPNVQMKCTS